MTIKECIDIVDNLKPNQYSLKEKVMWLTFIDEIIINDVLKTHEGYDGKYDDFAGYSEDKLSVQLIVGSPYDRLYTAYLKMKIDGENGETARYNNSASLFNSYLTEYRKHYNKTHMPLDVTGKKPMPKQSNSASISDAMFENLKQELYYLLSNDFSKMTSQDRIYDIVTSYMLNNVETFKGRDGVDGRDGMNGKDGKNGVNGKDGVDGADGKDGDDYILTDADKQEIADLISEESVSELKWQHLTTVEFQEEAQHYLSDKYDASVGIKGVYVKVSVPKSSEANTFMIRLMDTTQTEQIRVQPQGYVSATETMYGKAKVMLTNGMWDGWWTAALNAESSAWTTRYGLRYVDSGKTEADLPFVYRFIIGVANGKVLPVGTKMEVWVLKNV